MLAVFVWGYFINGLPCYVGGAGVWNAPAPIMGKKKEKRLSSRQLHKIVSTRMQREVGFSIMPQFAHSVSVLVRALHTDSVLIHSGLKYDARCG